MNGGQLHPQDEGSTMVSQPDAAATPPLATSMLLTMQQAADHLQISKSSLYREIGYGRLPVVKVRHLTRIRLGDLQEYVAGLTSSDAQPRLSLRPPLQEGSRPRRG